MKQGQLAELNRGVVIDLSQSGKTLALQLTHRVTLGKSFFFSWPQSSHAFNKIDDL